MPEYTLTLLDSAGIQRYVFGSNVLRENIGASELVRRATRLWPFQQASVLDQANLRADGPLTGDASDLDPGRRIEEGGLDVEVLYAGGGNCALLFADPGQARDFVTRLTCQVIQEAPELELVAVHVPFRWDPDTPAQSDALSRAMAQALDRLAVKKRDRAVSRPLLAVPTTAACRSTGLPAVGSDADEPDLKPAEEPPRILSAGILAKLRHVKPANQYLAELLPDFKDAGLEIPYDFDYFGREAGEISYIAVVHADGNNMSDRLARMREDFPAPADNRAYIDTMRRFSADVETASRQALGELGGLLLRHWRVSRNEITAATRNGGEGVTWLEDRAVTLNQKEGRRYIPFRPIVFGGDDLTFVTDGRLGLTLTAAYLRLFEEAAAARQNPYLEDLRAGAGVSVVKAHYPFSRAYDLAEQLADSAKIVWERKVSALDWHFAASGLFGELKDIRRRHYRVPAGWLTMRPVPLPEDADLWRSWPGFARVVMRLLTGDDWAGKRNKVIGLRQALRDGPDAVVRFRTAYELKALPELSPAVAALQERGWDGAGRCGYFDAVEAIDFFLPLEA
jgi:hypothetical protein